MLVENLLYVTLVLVENLRYVILVLVEYLLYVTLVLVEDLLYVIRCVVLGWPVVGTLGRWRGDLRERGISTLVGE